MTEEQKKYIQEIETCLFQECLTIKNHNLSEYFNELDYWREKQYFTRVENDHRFEYLEYCIKDNGLGIYKLDDTYPKQLSEPDEKRFLRFIVEYYSVKGVITELIKHIDELNKMVFDNNFDAKKMEEIKQNPIVLNAINDFMGQNNKLDKSKILDEETTKRIVTRTRIQAKEQSVEYMKQIDVLDNLGIDYTPVAYNEYDDLKTLSDGFANINEQVEKIKENDELTQKENLELYKAREYISHVNMKLKKAQLGSIDYNIDYLKDNQDEITETPEQGGMHM